MKNSGFRVGAYLVIKISVKILEYMFASLLVLNENPLKICL